MLQWMSWRWFSDQSHGLHKHEHHLYTGAPPLKLKWPWFWCVVFHVEHFSLVLEMFVEPHLWTSELSFSPECVNSWGIFIIGHHWDRLCYGFMGQDMLVGQCGAKVRWKWTTVHSQIWGMNVVSPKEPCWSYIVNAPFVCTHNWKSFLDAKVPDFCNSKLKPWYRLHLTKDASRS